MQKIVDFMNFLKEYLKWIFLMQTYQYRKFSTNN